MCADFLHPGHIKLLNAAAQYGKVTVLLMTDEAMISYKRAPFFSFDDRALILGALQDVSDIVPCHGIHTFQNICSEHQPHVFVHGDDWKTGKQANARLQVMESVAAYGGIVVEPPYTKGISSSMIHAALGPVAE